MATKEAGLGAAFVVLVVVFGLSFIVGVILLMMWFQPGIEHSPSKHAALSGFVNNSAAQVQEQRFIGTIAQDSGVKS